MSRLFQHGDKIVLAICVAAFLGSAGLALRGFNKLDAIAARAPGSSAVPAPYEPQTGEVPTIGRIFWPDAKPQSRGSEWIYDVFTPPVIYYNRQTAQFTVTPPAVSEPTLTPTEAPFEVELVSVRQEPYRVQLSGYAGDSGAFRAVLELVESGETVLAREGQRFDTAQAQFTLRSLEIRQMVTPVRDSMPVVETVAVATVFDERTGREEMLTNRERKMLPRLQAVLRLRGTPPEERSVREGASVEVSGYSYLVVQLSLNPPTAVISRRAPNSLGSSETRTLTPAGDHLSAPRAEERRPDRIFSFSSP